MKPRYKKCLYCLVFSLLGAASARAQNSVWNTGGTAKKTAGQKIEKTKGKLKDFKDHLQKWGLDTSYNHAFLAGGKLNTDGWSGRVDFVHRKKAINHMWQISFSEIKHEKQTKQQGVNKDFPQLGNATPYVFGKINNLYTLQVGYGEERMLLPGVMEGNISVSYRYSAGFSLAMLKPYMLKMLQVDYSTTPPNAHLLQDKYTQADSAQFLNPNLILGAATWSKSLSQTTLVPGAYFESAIAIIPGINKTFVQVITLGVNAAIYSQALPIMQGQQAYPWQANLFAGLGIGKRWK